MSDVRLVGDQPVRLLAEAVSAQGKTLIVLVGESLKDRRRALGDLAGVLSVGGPVALTLASMAGFLLTGAALRPVEAMRRRAAAISATSLADRLQPAGGNDELGRLGRTLNEMLTRIHTSVARERAFVSDASHELRSPLAMLRTELELLARERPAGNALQRAVGSAIEETDRLSRLADDLLLLARADDDKLAVRTSRVSAADLLDQAADRARRQPASARRRITVDAPAEAHVLADRDLVAQAIDNLLANALRCARTEIKLSARTRHEYVELHLIDDGPGFPPDFLPQAWERFARADSARTDDGTGLGLAIVRTIAEAHNGEARLANRAGGGADAWVSLARAADGAGVAPEPAGATPAA